MPERRFHSKQTTWSGAWVREKEGNSTEGSADTDGLCKKTGMECTRVKGRVRWEEKRGWERREREREKRKVEYYECTDKERERQKLNPSADRKKMKRKRERDASIEKGSMLLHYSDQQFSHEFIKTEKRNFSSGYNSELRLSYISWFFN